MVVLGNVVTVGGVDVVDEVEDTADVVVVLLVVVAPFTVVVVAPFAVVVAPAFPVVPVPAMVVCPGNVEPPGNVVSTQFGSLTFGGGGGEP